MVEDPANDTRQDYGNFPFNSGNPRLPQNDPRTNRGGAHNIRGNSPNVQKYRQGQYFNGAPSGPEPQVPFGNGPFELPFGQHGMSDNPNKGASSLGQAEGQRSNNFEHSYSRGNIPVTNTDSRGGQIVQGSIKPVTLGPTETPITVSSYTGRGLVTFTKRPTENAAGSQAIFTRPAETAPAKYTGRGVFTYNPYGKPPTVTQQPTINPYRANNNHNINNPSGKPSANIRKNIDNGPVAGQVRVNDPWHNTRHESSTPAGRLVNPFTSTPGLYSGSKVGEGHGFRVKVNPDLGTSTAPTNPAYIRRLETNSPERPVATKQGNAYSSFTFSSATTPLGTQMFNPYGKHTTPEVNPYHEIRKPEAHASHDKEEKHVSHLPNFKNPKPSIDPFEARVTKDRSHFPRPSPATEFQGFDRYDVRGFDHLANRHSDIWDDESANSVLGNC